MQTNNPRGKTERKNGSSKVQNFVVQGSILAAAGIIVRLIGMVYRIPLIDIIGQEETDIIRRHTACIRFF